LQLVFGTPPGDKRSKKFPVVFLVFFERNTKTTLNGPFTALRAETDNRSALWMNINSKLVLLFHLTMSPNKR
jgi:hypothetical protein